MMELTLQTPMALRAAKSIVPRPKWSSSQNLSSTARCV